MTYLQQYDTLQQYATYLLQYDILQQYVTYLLRYDILLQYVTYLLRYDILQQYVTYLPHVGTAGAFRMLFVCWFISLPITTSSALNHLSANTLLRHFCWQLGSFHSISITGINASSVARGGYSPLPPIGLSTKMQNKKNTTFLALLRLVFALELTKKWFKVSF